MQPNDTKKTREKTNCSQLDKNKNKFTAKVNGYRKEAVFLLQRKSKIEVQKLNLKQIIILTCNLVAEKETGMY